MASIILHIFTYLINPPCMEAIFHFRCHCRPLHRHPLILLGLLVPIVGCLLAPTPLHGTLPSSLQHHSIVMWQYCHELRSLKPYTIIISLILRFSTFGHSGSSARLHSEHWPGLSFQLGKDLLPNVGCHSVPCGMLDCGSQFFCWLSAVDLP